MKDCADACIIRISVAISLCIFGEKSHETAKNMEKSVFL